MSYSHGRALLALALLAAPVPALAQVADVTYGPDGLAFEPLVAVDGLTVSASGPGDVAVTRSYPGGGSAIFLIFDENGDVLPDGVYTYQLTGSPALDAETEAAMAACREAANCDGVMAALRESGALPAEADMVQSGNFAIDAGYLLLPSDEDAIATRASTSGGTNDQDVPTRDVQHLDDVIVTGGLCVGFDCVNGESFGFDDVRLKENNVRMHFDDTSNTASYPRNDWRIAINDRTNGGASYFRLEDSTAGRWPVTIRAGAANDSLYVDSQGDVGFGTSNPVTEMHSKDSDTPTLRLEQDSSGGWSPQTWDVAGNETNFFIRDVTNASRLPFRIKPGAPTDSIFIASDGDVGMGAGTSPATPLHLRRTTAAAKLDMLKLENNGQPRMVYTNSASGVSWKLGLDNPLSGQDAFTISRYGSGGVEFVIFKGGNVRMGRGGAFVFDLKPSGDLFLTGQMNAAAYNIVSSRHAKENFAAVDGRGVLDRLRELPITTWSYKRDTSGARHIGPMAQDFQAAFALGADDRHISLMDASGVALAAVKELLAVIEEKDAQISALEERVSAVEEIVSKLARGSGALTPASGNRGAEALH